MAELSCKRVQKCKKGDDADCQEAFTLGPLGFYGNWLNKYSASINTQPFTSYAHFGLFQFNSTKKMMLKVRKNGDIII